MSRIKSRQNTDLCADCGATDPSWVSINKGIYLCAECCSVHRSFGRHISQVRHINKSIWPSTLLAMVQTLNNNGVNNIWEHLLLDNSGKLLKRKPQPKEPLHPTKAEFITAKHVQLAFVFRGSRDDTMCTENELSKQLHSSVRTNNLEASLKLLLQGADPNYFHDEKGTTPLHVAARGGQPGQAELLLVYGADPGTPDAHGVSAVEYARHAGHNELAARLQDSLYEVTDKLSMYVTGKRPDHSSGKHFLIPETTNASPQRDTMALSKLQKLPSNLFERLIIDVYDEIDRRETEAIWMSSSESLELPSVPFLPVDPSFSTTRNQGRQKLARFTVPELKQLVTDLLIEVRRRQSPFLTDASAKHLSRISDDEPLYDSVASDEDYAVPPTPTDTQSTVDHTIREQPGNNCVNPSALEVLTKRLLQSDTTISDLRAEVRVLQSMVRQLSSENTELRSRLSVASSMNGHQTNEGSTSVRHAHSLSSRHGSQYTTTPTEPTKRGQRPSSMYEPREGLRPVNNWQLLKSQLRDTSESKALEYRLTKATERVTHCIQELWKCIQGPTRAESCVPGADKIRAAVAELTTVLPSGTCSEDITLLHERSAQLQLECAKLQQTITAGETPDLDYYMQKVRSCAYDIAKTIKSLISRFAQNEQLNNN